jgi:hypothetical protein
VDAVASWPTSRNRTAWPNAAGEPASPSGGVIACHPTVVLVSVLGPTPVGSVDQVGHRQLATGPLVHAGPIVDHPCSRRIDVAGPANQDVGYSSIFAP